jgi:hypothetical protein
MLKDGNKFLVERELGLNLVKSLDHQIEIPVSGLTCITSLARQISGSRVSPREVREKR